MLIFLKPSSCSLFYKIQKVLVWSCWKSSDFSKLPIAFPLILKPGFYINCLSPQAHCLNDIFFLLQTKSLFWPTLGCQILINFSFLESLQVRNKETDCSSVAEKLLQIIFIQPVKINLHFSFLNIKLGYLRFC